MYFQRIKKILFITLILNIVLVSTHKGEFWPFSIFPMFSVAGEPWSRGVVEQIEDINRPNLWKIKPLKLIEERILPLQDYGIHPIDYANYVSKTKVWDEEKINGLRSTFQIDHYEDKMWMAHRVKGFLNKNKEVVMHTYPLFLFTADTTYKNPHSFYARNDE